MTHPDDEDIRCRVLRLVAAMSPAVPDAALEGQERLIDDLGFDSIRLLELLMLIERAFALPAHRPEQLTDIRCADDVAALAVRSVRTGVA